MLLDAVVKAAMHGIGGGEMVEFKKFRFAELIATQSADGAITIFSGAPGFWDNHDQAYMIQAFVLDHRHFGNGDSLAAALRLGEFLIRRGTSLNLGLETAFLMLFQESGDRRFLDYCRNEFKLTEPLDVYDRMIPVNGIAHVYTWIARVFAQLQYAQLTGEACEALFSGARELYCRVFSDYSSISGSCSGGISWGEVWDDSQAGLGRWGETCVSAYLLRCTAKMFEFDANSVYGDLYERVMYNAFFGAQSADGFRQRYFIPFNEPGEWYGNETYCCPNNLRRMMFELPDAVYFEAPDGIAVNLFTDSELSTPNAKLRQKTGGPESEEIELRVESDSEFALYLRIPSWCTEARIRVDGTELRGKCGNWFRLFRKWNGSTEIRIYFPAPVRLIRGTMAQTNRAAVMRGPLVYAVEGERNGLSGHQLDLLTIDNLQPFTLVPEGIRIPCVIPNGKHPHPDVLFTRFSEEKHSRTYFSLTSGKGICDDELYKIDKGRL